MPYAPKCEQDERERSYLEGRDGQVHLARKGAMSNAEVIKVTLIYVYNKRIRSNVTYIKRLPSQNATAILRLTYQYIALELSYLKFAHPSIMHHLLCFCLILRNSFAQSRFLPLTSTFNDFPYQYIRDRDSAVDIATGYRLDDQWLELKSRWGQEFSLLHVVQTRSGAHLAPYPMGTVGSFSGGKAAGA
jgi:hypothetical protein